MSTTSKVHLSTIETLFQTTNLVWITISVKSIIFLSILQECAIQLGNAMN